MLQTYIYTDKTLMLIFENPQPKCVSIVGGQNWNKSRLVQEINWLLVVGEKEMFFLSWKQINFVSVICYNFALEVTSLY